MSLEPEDLTPLFVPSCFFGPGGYEIRHTSTILWLSLSINYFLLVTIHMSLYNPFEKKHKNLEIFMSASRLSSMPVTVATMVISDTDPFWLVSTQAMSVIHDHTATLGYKVSRICLGGRRSIHHKYQSVWTCMILIKWYITSLDTNANSGVICVRHSVGIFYVLTNKACVKIRVQS